MAHWKRLTGTDGDHVDVNMDVVAYLHGFKDHTTVCFIGGRNAEGKAMMVSVKESPTPFTSLIRFARPKNYGRLQGQTKREGY